MRNVLVITVLLACSVASGEDTVKQGKTYGTAYEVKLQELKKKAEAKAEKMKKLTAEMLKEVDEATKLAVEGFEFACKTILPLKTGVTQRTVNRFSNIDFDKAKVEIRKMVEETQFFDAKQKQMAVKALNAFDVKSLVNDKSFRLAINGKDSKQLKFAQALINKKFPFDLLIFNYDSVEDYANIATKIEGGRVYPGLDKYVTELDLKWFPTMIKIEAKTTVLIEGLPQAEKK